MIIELHILQNFAPSCLNRDDLNAPKNCDFGGVRRARISSQCLKRSTRWNPDFSESLTSGIGTRTKLLKTEVVKFLAEKGKNPEEADKVCEPVVAAIGSGVDKGRTAIALYLGHDEIRRIGEAVLARYDDLLSAVAEESSTSEEEKGKKPAKKAKKGAGTEAAKAIAEEISKGFKPGTKAADIALFGRMIAEATNFNVDAASQVAHAISTHAVNAEDDFFTAVDDLQPKGDPGAGMMGTQKFNSATFYRYANVHLPELAKNLQNDLGLVREAAAAFALAFISAIPSAKQNSHAAHNPPDFVMITIRKKGHPLSLANAFAEPVRANGTGIIKGSTELLLGYCARVRKAYGADGVAAAYFSLTDDLKPELAKGAGTTPVDGLDDLMKFLRKEIEAWQPKEEGK